MSSGGLSGLSGFAEAVEKAAAGNNKLAKSLNPTVTKLASMELTLTNLTPAIAAVGVALAGLAIYNAYKGWVKEQVDGAKQLASAWTEQKKSIEDYKAKAEELREKLDSGNLSEDEAYQTKAELLKIQNELNSTYGEYASQLDLVNGKIEEQLGLLEKHDASRFLNEGKKGIDIAQKEMEKQRSLGLGYLHVFSNDDVNAWEQLQPIIDKYDDITASRDEKTNAIKITFTGDASQAEETINSFMDDVRGLQNEIGENSLLDSVLDSSSGSLNKAEKVLKEYGDLYRQAAQANLITDKTNIQDLLPSGSDYQGGTFGDLYKDYAESIVQYNKAIEDGSATALTDAEERMTSLAGVISSLDESGNLGSYAGLFDELTGEINEAGAAAIKFKDALGGTELKDAANALNEMSADELAYEIQYLASGADDANPSLKALVDKAIELGYISDSTAEEIQKVADAVIHVSDVASAPINLSEALKTAQTDAANLTAALKESSSATGLASETIANVKAAFGDLESYDPAKLFERTATGVRLNKEAMEQLNKEYESNARANYEAKIAELQMRYGELVTSIDDSTMSVDEYNAAMSQIQGLEGEIQDVQMLKAQYDALTSSYNAFVNAQSASNDRDAYANIGDSYEKVKELLDNGWSGDSEVTNYLDLMLGENWRSDFSDAYSAFDQLTSKIGGTNYSLMDFFQYDESTKKLTTDGLYNFLDTVKALDDSLVQVDEQGNYSFDWSGRVEEVANLLGTSVENVELMELALRDAGFDIWFDPLNEDINALASNLTQTKDNLEQLKPAALDSVNALREMGYLKDVNFDFSTDSLDNLQTQLDAAKQLLADMTDENGEVDVEFKESGYDDLVTIIQTLMNQKHQIEQPVIMRIDTSNASSDVMSLIGLLQDFWSLSSQRHDMLEVNANADTSDVDAKIDGVLSKIKEVPDEVRSQVIVDDSQLTALSAAIDQLTSTDNNGKKIQVSAQIREDSITSIETAINSIEAKDVTVATNSDDVIDELNKVDAYNFKVKQLTVNFPGYSARQRELDNLRSSLNGLKDRSVTITTNRVTRTTTIGGGGTQVSGTAHAGGTAFARGSVYGRAYKGGSWRAGVRGESLGGELGPELRVRDGLWELIGGDSAEFFDVRPNDIIFNAEQTRQLLKNGKITNGAKRGAAYADGTVGGFAFSGDGPGRRKRKSSTASASKKGGSKKSSGGSNRSGNSGGSSGKGGKSSSTALDAFKDWFSSLFDWIEVKLKRQTDNISDYIAKAELQTETGRYGSATNNYARAISGTATKAETEAQAYQRYNAQANGVMSRAVKNGLVSSKEAANLKKLVANGKVDIKRYNENIQEVIKSYQQWYDKAMESKYAITELHTAIQGYVADLKKVRDAQRDAKLDSIKTYTEIGNSTFGFSVGKKNDQLSYGNTQFASQNAAYSNAVSGVETDTKALRTSANSGIKSALKAAKKSKNKKYQAALKNAQAAIKNNKPVAAKDMDVIVKYSRAVYERIYAYNLELENIETSKLEYAAIYATNSAEMFGNIAGVYDNNNSKYESNISLYKQISANKASASDKNSVLNQAASQYDSIVSNRLAEVNRFSSSVNTNRGIIGGKYTGGNYKTLSQKDKSAVDKVVASAKSYANKNQPIPASVISALAKYYSKGYISAAFYNACVDYNNAVEYKAQSEAQLEIDKQTAIAEKAALGTERLSNVQKEYENSQRSNVQIGLNKATSVQNLKKARSQDLSEQDYRDLISYNAKEATIWANAQKATQKIVDENLKLGLWTTTSQEYLDAVAAVAEYGVKVDEANTTIEGLKDSLRDDVYWRTFERAHDAAERLSNILSGINDLIDDNSLFDKSGGLTDFGAARIAMLTKELANARSEVKNYSNDIANLNKLYSDGQYTEQEYKEKLNDIQTELLKSASSAKSYTDSLVDMYKQMAKAELDMLLDVIQARQDALKSKKDYYDYDKELRSQTNDVQALQAQLAALEGIDTAEAKARMAKLSAELSDKQEDLDDMLRDHAFDLSNEALNKLKDTLQDAFDDKWDHISGDLSSITELISASNDLSATSAKDIQATLNKLLNFYGVDPVPTGVSASYASGTKKTPRGLIARTNENGPEIIVRKDGIITPLPAGSGVVPSNLTEKLYQMAEDYNPHASAAAHYVGIPKIESGAIGQTVVHQHYDSLINIEGSADAATVEDLKKMKSELLDELGSVKLVVHSK